MCKYKKDDIIKCKITAIKEYGFFVKVDEEHTGLVHISEISDYYVPKIEAHVNLEDEVELQVIGYNEDRKQGSGHNEDKKQLKLSFKSIRPELLKEKVVSSASFESVDSEIKQK